MLCAEIKRTISKSRLQISASPNTFSARFSARLA